MTVPSAPTRAPLVRLEDALWVVEVTAGGRPRRFVFDTAAGITALDTSLVRELELAPYGRMTGHRMTGARIDLACVANPGLRIGPCALAADVLGVLDLNALLPDGWGRVDGVLALDVFASQPLSIDLRDRTLVLETDASLAERRRSLRPLRIRLARGCQGAALDVFVEARGRHGPVWLELDAGNTGSALLAPHAVEELGIAAGDPIPLEGLGPVACAWIERDLIYDGNLGATFLDGRVVTLDLARGQGFCSA